MTTRPTDEDIRAMAAEIRATWPKADPLVRESRCNSAANMLEAWLTERKTARDGVTHEMIAIARSAYRKVIVEASGNVARDELHDEAMRVALCSVLSNNP